MQIPCIKVIETAQDAEAISAIRIASLLHSELLLNGYYRTAAHGQYSATNSIDPLQLHHTREDLLSALAGWDDTTLEIRLAVVPDIALRTQSLISLHLIVRCPASDAEAAREKVAKRHLALHPLLTAQIPEAVCETVTDHKELDQILGWLRPKHGVSIHRRRETVSLANPLDLPSAAIGFNSSKAKESLPCLRSTDQTSLPLDSRVGRLESAARHPDLPDRSAPHHLPFEAPSGSRRRPTTAA